MMKNYELTIVLDGKMSAAKLKSASEKVTKLLEAFKGKIGKVEDWGEKELAYPIAKKEVGHYILFPIQMGTSEAKSLADKLRLEEDLLRYLLIRV
ncbi:30S ribosomal protein S6 [Candidatus Microgenomates bacterium]|nr:30S ribosomal protein S6 [Candidatus Microgenomates bacterium]